MYYFILFSYLFIIPISYSIHYFILSIFYSIDSSIALPIKIDCYYVPKLRQYVAVPCVVKNKYLQ